MPVVGRGSATATVEEVTTAAAEEADDGPKIAPQNLERGWLWHGNGFVCLESLMGCPDGSGTKTKLYEPVSQIACVSEVEGIGGLATHFFSAIHHALLSN